MSGGGAADGLMERAMGELTLWDRLREWIGSIAWLVFLWASEHTEEEYWRIIRESFEHEGVCGECGNREDTALIWGGHDKDCKWAIPF